MATINSQWDAEAKRKISKQIQSIVDELNNRGLKYDDLNVKDQRGLINKIKKNLEEENIELKEDSFYVFRVLDLQRGRRKAKSLDNSLPPSQPSADSTPLFESSATVAQTCDDQSDDSFTVRKERIHVKSVVDKLREANKKYKDLSEPEQEKWIETIKTRLTEDAVKVKEDKHYHYHIRNMEDDRERVERRKKEAKLSIAATRAEPSAASQHPITYLPYDPIRDR